LKNLIKSALSELGLELRKNPFKTNFTIAESEHLPSVKASVIDDIFDFIKNVPPFYSEETPSQLKIAGAWMEPFRGRIC
jgi:hypothetical protein